VFKGGGLDAKKELRSAAIGQFEASRYLRGQKGVVLIALAATYISVFVKLWTPISLNRWFEATAVLLFFIPLFRYWAELKKDVLIRFLFLAILVPFVFFLINYVNSPELAVNYYGVEQLPRVYLFVFSAWWLGGTLTNCTWFYGLAVLGILFAITVNPDFSSHFESMLEGKRVDFSIRNLNAQQTGLFFSLIIIGALSYLPSALKSTASYRKVLGLLLISGLVILGAAGVFASQTRAAFLGLFVVLLLAFVRLIYRQFKFKDAHRLNKNKASVAMVACAVVVAVVVTMIAVKPLMKRISPESETINLLLSGEFRQLPDSSIGIRIKTWAVALDWIKQKPLIGYGGSVRQHVIQDSDLLSPFIKEHFGHFHNSFIEISLAYGLLGLILVLAPFALGLRYLKNSLIDEPVKNFFLYGSVLFLVMNVFESYLFFWTGPYVLTFLLGPYFSQVFAIRVSQASVAK
jgi:O-antigen ligase